MTTKVLWPLASNSWGGAESDAIRKVLASGRFTMGPKVQEFEEVIAAMHDRTRAVMVNSGSSANLIAVAALAHAGKIRSGDEAIVPAIAWSTTYAPLHHFGLKLKVVDVDLETLNMDCDQLAEATNHKTRLIMGVSILGNPADLRYMEEFSNQNGLVLMEDNCESFGAQVGRQGRLAGSFGRVSTLSTFFSHHLNTVEGGVLLTNDDMLADLAICLRAHGWTRDLPEGSKISIRKGSDFDSDYDFVLPGFNVRPTEFAGAAGLVQITKLRNMQGWRRANATFFIDTFGEDPRFVLQKLEPGAVPFGFTVICKSPEARKQAVKLLSEKGIESRLITGGCFTRHRSSSFYDFSTVGDLPNANRAHDCGFFVGNHPFDLSKQILAMRYALEDLQP